VPDAYTKVSGQNADLARFRAGKSLAMERKDLPLAGTVAFYAPVKKVAGVNVERTHVFSDNLGNTNPIDQFSVVIEVDGKKRRRVLTFKSAQMMFGEAVAHALDRAKYLKAEKVPGRQAIGAIYGGTGSKAGPGAHRYWVSMAKRSADIAGQVRVGRLPATKLRRFKGQRRYVMDSTTPYKLTSAALAESSDKDLHNAYNEAVAARATQSPFLTRDDARLLQLLARHGGPVIRSHLAAAKRGYKIDGSRAPARSIFAAFKAAALGSISYVLEGANAVSLLKRAQQKEHTRYLELAIPSVQANPADYNMARALVDQKRADLESVKVVGGPYNGMSVLELYRTYAKSIGTPATPAAVEAIAATPAAPAAEETGLGIGDLFESTEA
jgi:hypothetical protein